MKSLSLLAEKYQEIQFNDPIVMVASHSPQQLLESLKGYNETHDLKAVFNYIAESRESGSALVTESLIEENVAAAATILAIEKILTYYIEGKDSEFNKKVLLTLEAKDYWRVTEPPGENKKTAPASKGGGFLAGAKNVVGKGMAGLKNVVGKGLEYLGKAANKFAGGATSGKAAGNVEDLPYETVETQADLSTLIKNIVPINPATLTSTYNVSPDLLTKLKNGQIGGINLTKDNKFAEIKYGKNGLYTIRSLTPAEKNVTDKEKAATKKEATKAPASTDTGYLGASYVPFTSLANKVLKEFNSTNKPLPLETNSKK